MSRAGSSLCQTRTSSMKRLPCPVNWANGSLPDGQRFYTADPWGNRLELVAAG